MAIAFQNARGQNCFHILSRFGHAGVVGALLLRREAEEREGACRAFDRAIRDQDKNRSSSRSGNAPMTRLPSCCH